jgi:(p)ppGpp synthase/HD superfamily hydrolase
MISVDAALKIASETHSGQRDKGNKPYILHPIRVGMAVAKYGEDHMVVGFLHDVIEDHPFLNVQQGLKMAESWGLTEMQLDALSRLSKDPENPFTTVWMGMKLNERRSQALRCQVNPIARAVKIADLEDNMDITRLKNGADLQQKDLDRINDYSWSWHFLTGA